MFTKQADQQNQNHISKTYFFYDTKPLIRILCVDGGLWRTNIGGMWRCGDVEWPWIIALEQSQNPNMLRSHEIHKSDIYH